MADDGDNVVGGVSVKVTADLSQYKADLAQGQALAQQFDSSASAAMGRTSAAMATLSVNQQAVVKGMLAANVSAKDAAASFTAMGASGAQMAAAYAQITAAAQPAAAATLEVAAATQNATLASSGLADALAKAAAAAGSNTRALQLQAAATVENTVANEGHAISSALVTRELLVMGREASRANFNRMAGSATILAQGLGLLSPELIAVTASVVAVAAAAVLAAAATIQYDAAQKKLTETSVGLGAASGQSAAQLEASAQAAQSASAISLSSARAAAEAFAAAGVQDQDTITEMTASVQTFADLTGQKTPAAVKELATALADPAKGAADLNEKFGFLDAVELKNIQTMAALGDKTGAQTRLTQDFYTWMNNASTAAGGLESWLEQLKSGFDRLSNAVGGTISKLIDFYTAASRTGPSGPNPEEIRRLQLTAQVNEASTAGAQVADAVQDPSDARRQQLQGDIGKLQGGIVANKALGNSAEVVRETEALLEYERALSTVNGTEQQRHQLALLEQQDAKAKTPQEKADVAAKRALIEANGELVSSTDLAQRAADAADTAEARKAAHVPKPKKDQVAEETEKIKANTAALLEEASAYAAADSASAMKIAAGGQAQEYSTTHPKADVGQMTSLYLGQDVAKAADSGGKQLGQLTEQTAAMKALNDQVAAGAMTAQEADRQLKDESELRPLIAAEANAEGAAKAELATIIAGLTAAQKASNDEANRAKVLADTGADRQKLADLQQEATLLGKTNAERDIAIAQAEAMRQLKAAGVSPASPEGKALVSTAGQVGQQQATNQNESFVATQTQTLNDQIKALKETALTYGMTKEAAAQYMETEKLLEDAEREHLTLTPQQVQQLKDLAAGYAQATTAAKQLQEQQKASAEAASSLADSFESAISGMLYGGKTLQATLSELSKTLGQEALKGVLTGGGPFAGMMGTSQTGVQGGANGGILSQLFGSAFKQPGASPNNLVGELTGGASKNFAATLQGPVTPGSVLDALTKPQMGAGGSSNPLASLLGIGGSGAGVGDTADMGSPTTAGVFHAGTSSVGYSNPSVRTVASSLFVRAPRLHSGLASDEFPAILQKGEGVTPRGGNSGGHVVNVNVHGVHDTQQWNRNRRQIGRQVRSSLRG